MNALRALAVIYVGFKAFSVFPPLFALVFVGLFAMMVAPSNPD